ncbi:MAG TPA: SigE family RNA polymerase sigma factor [Streptosporangiaceae bacterium]|nr:SigE family RNA polymerase sigma factor [Streptosporangiaceae bacterium]
MSREQEFGEFASSRASPLHRSAYLLCGDWHLAEDLAQDTLVKAYQHWGRVSRADNPDAYVRRILLNEARQRWRRRDRDLPVAAFGAEPVILDGTEAIARREGLLQALLTLPFHQRATVVLRYLEGLSERETAEVLRCSEGTVKSQASRALASLRNFLTRTDTTL